MSSDKLEYMIMKEENQENKMEDVTSVTEAVAGHGGGRKLSCIDGINTTIYYRKKVPR